MLINRPDMENYRKARKLLASPGGEAEAKNILTSSNVLEQNLLAIMLIRPNLNLHNVSCPRRKNCFSLVFNQVQFLVRLVFLGMYLRKCH